MGKLYNFFSGTNNRSGKGISKKQVEFDKKLGFGFFFRLLKMRLGKFSGTNLIFALCNICFFTFFMGYIGIFNDTATTIADPLFAQINAIAKNENGPVISTLYNLYCTTGSVSVATTASQILKYSGYVLFITFGLSTIGMVYNIRNVCTGEHVDTWNDFFYAIKRNFKQGIVISIIDAVVLYLLVYDLVIYGASQGNSFMHLVFFYAIILITAIYYLMRFYIYLQLVTCEMKIGKMFKNAFLLVSLGIKRNIVGLVSAIAFVVLFMYLYILLPQASIILFCMFVFAFLTYIGVYCAYPVFKRYVIDPYYEDNPDERPEDPWSSDDRVFVDRE